MPKIISKWYEDGENCNSCNWKVNKLYSFETNPIDTEDLCGDCFMDMLEETTQRGEHKILGKRETLQLSDIITIRIKENPILHDHNALRERIQQTIETYPKNKP
jgi:hypothetical protein